MDSVHTTLRLLVVNRPGVLTGVAQVFALLGVNIDDLTLRRDPHDPARAWMVFRLTTDLRSIDLICRKLTRLLDVMDVQHQVEPLAKQIPPSVELWGGHPAPAREPT
jgi:acetolactate synthase small subunit